MFVAARHGVHVQAAVRDAPFVRPPVDRPHFVKYPSDVVSSKVRAGGVRGMKVKAKTFKFTFDATAETELAFQRCLEVQFKVALEWIKEFLKSDEESRTPCLHRHRRPELRVTLS